MNTNTNTNNFILLRIKNKKTLPTSYFSMVSVVLTHVRCATCNEVVMWLMRHPNVIDTLQKWDIFTNNWPILKIYLSIPIF